MKIVNGIVRVFSIVAIITALLLYFILGKTEGEYIGSMITVLSSSIALFFVTFLLPFFKKRNILISNTLYAIILFSFILSMGGGFIFRFYQTFNYYDTVVHFLNGMILVIIVFVVLEFLTEESKKYVILIILVAILGSISLGTLWEITEYILDLIIPGNNMQRFQDVKTGIDYIGQLALKDTMIDLIVDTLGAILAGILLYFDSIKNSTFINKIILKKID